MMDTQYSDDQVRRLLALAAEDVPPGLDLLAGFQARRRRPRTRILVAAATMAAAAVAVAVTIALTLTAGPAPSARAAVIRAAAATAAQSYRVSSHVTVRQSPSQFAAPSPVTITGAFDPAHGTGEESIGGSAGVRYAGRYLYVPIPAGYRKVYGNMYHQALRPGQIWVRLTEPQEVDRGSLGLAFALQGNTVLSAQQLNPQGLLTLLRSASQVRGTGHVSGPGWTGTQYSFSVTAALNPKSPNTLTLATRGTVDVDQRGRVRRLAATETVRDVSLPRGATAATVTSIDVTFSGFGQPVPVTIPSASQVFIPPSSQR